MSMKIETKKDKINVDDISRTIVQRVRWMEHMQQQFSGKVDFELDNTYKEPNNHCKHLISRLSYLAEVMNRC